MRSTLKAALAALCVALAPACGTAQGIDIQELPAPDAWTVAGAAADGPSLTRTLWSGSTPAQLSAAFDALPAKFDSHQAAKLARRALASPGAAPRGEGGAEALRKRFEAMARLGVAASLAEMTSGGAAAKDQAIASYGLQALLALGQTEEACARVDAVTADPPLPFILRLRALCFAIDENQAAADLAMAVARRNDAADAWLFATLPFVAQRGAGAPPRAQYDTSLNAAVSLRLELAPPPRGALANASALALVAVALHDKAPAGLRPLAAADALKQAAITPKAARDALRDSAARAGAARLGPLTTAVRDMDAGSEEARAQVLGRVLLGANRPSQFRTTALVFQEELRRLAPYDGPSAAAFARAALLNGDLAQARRHREVAAGAPEAMLADLDVALDAAAMRPAPDRRDMAQAISRDPDRSAPIQDAAVRGAVGEAALLAAALFAPGGETLNPVEFENALRALETLGLLEEARALRVETLVARGQ